MSNAIKFGTDGWRAVIAEDFTFANVERVVYAIGVYIKQTYHKDPANRNLPALIGYDTRFLADEFAKRAARVLMTMGIPVKLANRDVPTPVIAYAASIEPTVGALQFTASHNPPQYCGIKYIPHFGGPATNETTNQIVSLLNEIPADFSVKQLNCETFDPMPGYLKAITQKIDTKKIGSSGLKIAYDALYSTSRGYLDKILADTGLTLTVLHNWRDPLFGGGMPEPKPECLTELIATVKEKKLSVGLATDGDADRFGVIDYKGNYLSPNMLLALLTRHLVKNKGQKGIIVRTVATTHLLDCLAKKYDLEIVETPVGFKYIGEIMRQKEVLIGGEESGGVSIKGHIPEKDGILGNLLLIELMAYEGKPLSQIWADLLAETGVTFIGRRRDLHLTMPIQRGLMERLIADPFKTVGAEKVAKVGNADGLKFYFDDFNWLLVRPSGTEPLIRLYFEGTDEKRVDAAVAAFQKQVDEIVAQLESGSGSEAKVKVNA